MKFQKQLQRICAVVCLVFVLCIAQAAFSQDYPSKPITIFYVSEAGSSGDLMARAWATEAQKELNVSVVVENHTGGSGAVAAALLSRKKPDGYTLLITPFHQLVTTPLMVSVGFDPAKDFIFLASGATNMGGICVKSDSPFKTLKDLIEYARKNPEKATYSTPGAGGPAHLGIELIAQQANVKFKHVPYKGGAPAMTALLGGHVMFNAGAGSHISYVKQGLVKMLALNFSNKRDPDFPDVPTLEELGYKDLPPNPYVLCAPAGLPKTVATKLEKAFVKAAQSAEYKNAAAKFELSLAIKDSAGVTKDFQYLNQLYPDIINKLGLAKK